jgi:ABC-type transporter Mla MlaB component
MDTYNITYNTKKDLSEIEFSGHLTINNIEKIISEIKTNFKAGKTVSITTKDVENIDLTFIQMLYSLVKSGKNDRYDVNTHISVPDDLKQLLTNAGFCSLITENK